MRLKAVIPDLVVLALVIPAVTFIFRAVDDRKLAALMAGALFVLVPLALMLWRLQRPLHGRGAQACWWGGVLSFWLLFALPILGMRLWHWDLPFDQIHFLGVSGPIWHKTANSGYLVMMALVAMGGWLSSARRPAKAG